METGDRESKIGQTTKKPRVVILSEAKDLCICCTWFRTECKDPSSRLPRGSGLTRMTRRQIENLQFSRRHFAGRLAGGTIPFIRKYSTICP